MQRRTKTTMQAAASIARESKKKLPKNHFKKKAEERKKKMGPISRQETYPKEKLMELAGWGDAAWKNAVRTGLAITRNGVQYSVTGEAYFRWTEQNATVVSK